MTPIPLALIILLTCTAVPAAEGWQYTGDLNADGTPDTIRSGPQNLFGNAGGPFVVRLSRLNGTHREHAIFAHRLCMAPELVGQKNSPTLILWTYHRSNAYEGRLVRYEFGEKPKITKISIYPKSPVGKALYAAITASRLTLVKIPNYTVPSNPSGEQWGK
jgi:hypothetical protein